MTPVATQPPPGAQAAPVASAQRVTWRERVAFGVGGITSAYGSMGLKTLAIPVYQMTLKVDPALLGLMLAIPFFDPTQTSLT